MRSAKCFTSPLGRNTSTCLKRPCEIDSVPRARHPPIRHARAQVPTQQHNRTTKKRVPSIGHELKFHLDVEIREPAREGAAERTRGIRHRRQLDEQRQLATARLQPLQAVAMASELLELLAEEGLEW